MDLSPTLPHIAEYRERLTRIATLGQELEMPIRPENRCLYPIDWPQLSAVVRFKIAGGRCQHCKRPHGRTVQHLGDGRWFDEDTATWRDGNGRTIRSRSPRSLLSEPLTTRVVLATAHLDGNPTNNGAANLRALCQRCHMLHDQPEHRRRRWLTFRKRKALGDLFSGPYVRR